MSRLEVQARHRACKSLSGKTSTECKIADCGQLSVPPAARVRFALRDVSYTAALGLGHDWTTTPVKRAVRGNVRRARQTFVLLEEKTASALTRRVLQCTQSAPVATAHPPLYCTGSVASSAPAASPSTSCALVSVE